MQSMHVPQRERVPQRRLRPGQQALDPRLRNLIGIVGLQSLVWSGN